MDVEGTGRYDTYNHFDGLSVQGSGRARYVGGGVLLRQHWDTGIYAEGSLRAGQASADWGSSQMRGADDASYDTSSPYYGAHVGVGYVLPITPKLSLDTSAKYFWTHQDSDDATIAGDPYHFDAMDSQRTRLGTRAVYALTEQVAGYVGAAWEHEYDGAARATVYGLATPSPSLEGDTGVFELGMRVMPQATRHLKLDIGLQGYTGRREGFGGTLRAAWAF